MRGILLPIVVLACAFVDGPALAGPSVTPLGMQVASEQGDYRVLQFFWAFGAEVYHDRDYSRVALNSVTNPWAFSERWPWVDLATSCWF